MKTANVGSTECPLARSSQKSVGTENSLAHLKKDGSNRDVQRIGNWRLHCIG